MKPGKIGLNRTHKLWIYTDVNFLGKNMSTINRNTEAVLDTNRQADVHISIQKTKYIFMLHYQNGGQIKCKCRKQILKHYSFIHSFIWRVQNSTIPCRSQELFPFLSIMHFFLPPFSTDYSSILPHLVLPSISWPASQSCCSHIHI